VSAGLGGVARAGAHAAGDRLRNFGGLSDAAGRGQRAALLAGGSRSGSGAAQSASAADDGAPQWARQLRSEQAARHHRHAALQAVREGDRGGAGANPDIKEKED
jgi:type IV secretion system protein TrbL